MPNSYEESLKKLGMHRSQGELFYGKTWEFPVQGGDPIILEAELFSLNNPKHPNPHGEDKQRKLLIRLTGIRHPWLTKIWPTGPNYIGSETRNPALRPIVEFLRERLNEIVPRKVEEHGIKNATRDPKYTRLDSTRERNKFDFTSNSSNEFTGAIMFNPLKFYEDEHEPWFSQITWATDNELKKFFDGLVAEIDTWRAQIQKLVDDNRHLQPKANPSRDDLSKYESAIISASTDAISELQKTGYIATEREEWEAREADRQDKRNRSPNPDFN